MGTIDQQIKKNAALSGLLLGVVNLVCAVFSFYYITTMTSNIFMISLGPILFSILIPLVITILFSLDLRKKIGGFWSFKQAATGIFIMMFVGFLVSFVLYNVVFARVIEPNMVDKMQNAIVTASTGMMEKQGLDQDKIDQQISKITERFKDQKDFSIGSISKNLVSGILIYFILALILASFFKKEPPLFATPIDDLDPAV